MKKYMRINLLVFTILVVASCHKVYVNSSEDLTSENLKIVKQLTVINTINNDFVLQMTGIMSIKAGVNVLEIIVEDENGVRYTHFVSLNDWTTYVVEDFGVSEVENYKFSLNYNPKMLLPVWA